jgi:hypothetical protein
MESFISPKNKTKQNNIYKTKRNEPTAAHRKHFFKKCPLTGPLKTSLPSISCNL